MGIPICYAFLLHVHRMYHIPTDEGEGSPFTLLCNLPIPARILADGSLLCMHCYNRGSGYRHIGTTASSSSGNHARIGWVKSSREAVTRPVPELCANGFWYIIKCAPVTMCLVNLPSRLRKRNLQSRCVQRRNPLIFLPILPGSYAKRGSFEWFANGLGKYTRYQKTALAPPITAPVTTSAG